MTQIMQLAEKHNFLVIEDAAQAHLASIKNQPVGTFGHAAAFSFYPTKNMTAGEGGMIVFQDRSNARYARLMRNQGMEKRYQNEIIGFNLRMTDIHAAIGREQLKKLPIWTLRRQKNAAILNSRIKHVTTPSIPETFSHVFHQYTVRIPKNRDEFSRKLTELGIGNGIYYPTQVHKLPSFSRELDLPETANATSEVLSLPIHPSLAKRDLIRIADTVNRIAEEI